MALRNRTTLRLLAAALFAACLAGCADDPDVPQIKWKKSTTLPADFPKDVPVYPNAQFGTAVTGEGLPTEAGGLLSWTTQDKIQPVRHFFTEKLDEQGWHVISYPGVPTLWMGEGGVTVVATKWGRMVSFAIGAKDGATVISLVFPQK